MIITTYAFDGTPFFETDRICLESDTPDGHTNRYEFDFANYLSHYPDPLNQPDDFDGDGFAIITDYFYPSRVRVIPPGTTLIPTGNLHQVTLNTIKTGDIIVFHSKPDNITGEILAEGIDYNPTTGVLTIINDDFELYLDNNPAAQETLLGIR